MWSLKARALTRLPAVLALAGLTAGCFQPLYGDSRIVPTAGLDNKLSSVDVRPIDTPNGTPLARISVNVRNDLIYDLTGGGGTVAPTHRLDIRLSSSTSQVIVNINTGRTDVQDLGINANYTLIDLATGKTVVTGQTFSRVSYNIPGEQQRFVAARGRRDAEDRAAQVIADSIKQRLASYFVAGT